MLSARGFIWTSVSSWVERRGMSQFAHAQGAPLRLRVRIRVFLWYVMWGLSDYAFVFMSFVTVIVVQELKPSFMTEEMDVQQAALLPAEAGQGDGGNGPVAGPHQPPVVHRRDEDETQDDKPKGEEGAETPKQGSTRWTIPRKDRPAAGPNTGAGSVVTSGTAGPGARAVATPGNPVTSTARCTPPLLAVTPGCPRAFGSRTLL
jgi:hypothetical protein